MAPAYFPCTCLYHGALGIKGIFRFQNYPTGYNQLIMNESNPSLFLDEVNETSPGHVLNQSPASYLEEEFKKWQTLFASQPVLVQRFFDAQAAQLVNAILNNLTHIRFSLPDRIVLTAGDEKLATIPIKQRDHSIGNLWHRLRSVSNIVIVRQYLDQMEALFSTNDENKNIAIAAGLLRFATSHYMVYELLPAGRPVSYVVENGEEIPSIPIEDITMPGSAITATSDAIAEEQVEEKLDQDRGELLVPYMPAARRFYLPQWVAFDEHDQLLVGSFEEALANLESMKHFLRILHNAVNLAPYVVADEVYLRKRYGMLGQFVNQGRAVARYQVRQIITTIQRRVAEQNLNRGLSVSLPYLDDQNLEMKVYPFQIIPAGRILFVPAFVVRATRQEQVKVAQDTRLNPSTRKYLIQNLKLLEVAFQTSDKTLM
jgi:hypothetical protein